MSKWLRILIIGVVSFAILIVIMVTVFNTGMSTVKGLEIKEVALNAVADGIYQGDYSHGRWAYELEVEISQHRIVDIRVNSSHMDVSSDFVEQIRARIIAEQSLAIDVVSGASVNTKAFLKAMENALSK